MDPGLAEARAARGDLYYQQGKPDLAAADLEVAASKRPDDAAVLDKLGQSYSALDRTSDAVSVLRRAAELAPNESKIQLHFGRALADAGQTEESAKVMERFQQLGPSHMTIVPAGLMDYLSLSPEERRADYRARVMNAVKSDPTDGAAQQRYLAILLEDGNFDEAVAVERHIAGMKAGPGVLVDAGRSLMAAGQWKPAVELLSQAAAAGPSPEVELSLAVATFHASGAKEGLQRLDAINAPDRGGDYYLARAEMLDAAGGKTEATAAVEQALNAAPQRTDLYRQAAGFLVRTGKAAEALRILDGAAHAMPGNREILAIQATTMELAGKIDDAVEALTAIQKQWPEWPAAWAARGVILASHGRYEPAREALEAAFALGAHSAEARYYLADCELRARQAGAAEAAIQPALGLAPRDPWIQALAGRVALENRDYKTAAARFGEAVRVAPNLIAAHIGLVQAYTASGDKQKAQAETDAAKKIQPGAATPADPPFISRLFQENAPGEW